MRVLAHSINGLAYNALSERRRGRFGMGDATSVVAGVVTIRGLLDAIFAKKSVRFHRRDFFDNFHELRLRRAETVL